MGIACAPPPKTSSRSIDSGSDTEACAAPTLVPTQSLQDAELVAPETVEGDLGTGGPGLALADVDGDGWLDLVMAIPVAPSILFRNDGRGTLVADALALPPANAVSFADVDQDGAPDLWLGTHDAGPDLLLRNDGTGWASGTATSTELPGPWGESYGATWADFDGDGDLDAFISRFLRSFEVSDPDTATFDPTPNQLLRNDDGTLVDASDQLPPEILDDATFHAQVLDADLDGDLDIYLSNDFGIYWRPNDLLLNDGSGRFQRGPDCGCNLTIFGMGASAGDIDLDGDVDLYNTNLGGPVLLESEGDGRFYDATAVRQADISNSASSLASWGSALVDLDQDGRLDLATIFGQLVIGEGESLGSYAGGAGESFEDGPAQEDHLFRMSAAGTFDDISIASGFHDSRIGRAVVTGDLDRDGVPDLVTAGVPYLQTWTTEGGCGPGITVQGLPVGARVRVEVDGESWHLFHHPSTTLSSSAPEEIIGLRGAASAQRVVITHGEQVLLDETEVPAGARLSVASAW